MSRSVRLYEFGDASVLRIENVEIGAPASGEVRLRIHAIGINRTEITLRSGRSPAKPALPTGLGFEAAGVVETLGPDVTGVSVGDRVALVPSYGAAQYALYGEITASWRRGSRLEKSSSPSDPSSRGTFSCPASPFSRRTAWVISICPIVTMRPDSRAIPTTQPSSRSASEPPRNP
jgi:hypothetical protein